MNFRSSRRNAIFQALQSDTSSIGLGSQSQRPGLPKPPTNAPTAKKPRVLTSNAHTHIEPGHEVRTSASKNKAPTTRSLVEVRSQPTVDQSKFNFPPHLDPTYYKKFQNSAPLNPAKEMTPTSIEKPAAEIFAPQRRSTVVNEMMEGVIEMKDDVHENVVNVDDPLQQEIDQGIVKRSKSYRSRNMRSRRVAPDENGHIDYDDKEDILIIDAENKQKLLSGTIQPIDIDGLDDGFRCIVPYNEFNQPFKRGGVILIKYIGWMAKVEKFCPIGFETWHKVLDQFKVDILARVRDKFVIPGGQTYDKTILTRFAKSWRQNKSQLKSDYFNPDERTKDEISNDIPEGHTRDNWLRLVGHWYSKKGQDLSTTSKKARNSKTFTHTTGSTSFANKRVHYEEAKSKVEEVISNSSPSKSRIEIENEIFNDVMYDDAHPKRPVGFGFGVKQSQVFGVHSYLRKREYKSADTPDNSTQLQTRMSGLEQQNQELRSLLLQTLQAVRTGKISDDAFNGIQSALSKPDSQGASV